MISQSLIRPICAAWESAILPHPTIPTLSMLRLLLARPKIAIECILGLDARLPPKPLLQLFIRIARLFPIRMPDLPIVNRGQLSFRPGRVFFPNKTEQPAYGVREIDRSNSFCLFLVQTQKPTTGGQV